MGHLTAAQTITGDAHDERSDTVSTDATTTWPPDVATAVGDAHVEVVRVTGEERQSYLDAVLSQRLRDVAPGTATAALELGPNGEPNGVLDVAVLDDEVLLLVPSVLAEDVVGRLAGRTFLSDAHFETVTDATVRRVRGPAAHADAARAGLPATEGTATRVGEVLVLVDAHGLLLVATEVDRSALDGVVERLVAVGAVLADEEALDARELLTGRPRPPEEVVRGRLPEELGLLPTHVHLAKGCYPGQEAVARMWQLGRPRRRLVVLESDELLAPGDHGDGRPVTVTRSATVDGRAVALALAGRDVAVGDEPVPGAVVREVVGEGRPVPGHDPSVQRRRDTR